LRVSLFHGKDVPLARGGYRKPNKPAPVSGPGKLSRRTDGGPQPVRDLPNAAYGEGQQFRDIQSGAPMGSPSSSAPQPAAAPPAGLASVVPFGAPSQREGEPITAGAASGPGPGMDSLGIARPGNDPSVEYITSLLPVFELAASLPTASPHFRQFVRRLRGSA
jgi:hypothetical protein